MLLIFEFIKKKVVNLKVKDFIGTYLFIPDKVVFIHGNELIFFDLGCADDFRCIAQSPKFKGIRELFISTVTYNFGVLFIFICNELNNSRCDFEY